MSAGASSAGAKEVQTSFQVSATVRAVAVIESESAPADLQITAADIARGFIDIAQPMRLIVRSNSPDGFVIDLAAMSPVAASMIVHGLDADLDLGADGGSIVQRWQHPQSREISLTFRLVLAPALVAGRYPWPMRVFVRPL